MGNICWCAIVDINIIYNSDIINDINIMSDINIMASISNNLINLILGLTLTSWENNHYQCHYFEIRSIGIIRNCTIPCRNVNSMIALIGLETSTNKRIIPIQIWSLKSSSSIIPFKLLRILHHHPVSISLIRYNHT